MSDYYAEAVRTWQGANRDLKHFAECCALVDGHQTAALATDCRLSVDSIEAYRNAYSLYYSFDVEASETVRMWEQGNISLWLAAAKRRNSIEPDALKDYLSDAVENGATVEAFRVALDNHNRTKPEWTERLRKLVKTLFKLRTDYKSIDMPPAIRERFERAVQVFEMELQAIAEESELA
jgi:thymidylate synthase ThyX